MKPVVDHIMELTASPAQGGDDMVRIQFGSLRIDSVANASGIFSGNNKQWKYKHVAKRNQAFGSVNGKRCRVTRFRATLDDRDDFDAHAAFDRRSR